jgi:hypothetical protein
MSHIDAQPNPGLQIVGLFYYRSIGCRTAVTANQFSVEKLDQQGSYPACLARRIKVGRPTS